MINRLPTLVASNADWLRSPQARAALFALLLLFGAVLWSAARPGGLQGPARALSWVVPIATEATADLVGSLSGGQGGAEVASVRSLAGHLDTIGFQLSHVRDGRAEVPRWFVSSIPPDMPDVAAGDQRKSMFIAMLLPHVLYANELIMSDRERLLQVADAVHAGHKPGRADQHWLAELAERYGTVADDIAELKRRVDIVPPSLALAQAAEESGWGTSRYALDKNAVFGQYMPVERPGAAAQVIRPFDALDAAVQGYMQNLNSHNAYAAFRKKRERARIEGHDIGGRLLAPALTRYSERGVDYTRAISGIIRSNQLEHFDKARLGYTALPSRRG